MELIDFPERNVTYAEHQDEYADLPAYRDGSFEGRLVCCWALSWRERLQVLFSGRVWHQVLTFGKPLQPQLLTSKKPDMGGS